VAGTSRPTKAHFNWEIRYEPPQLAAVSDTAVGCDKGGIDPLGGLKLQEVFDSDSYSTASGTASVAAGAAKRESGLQVDMSNQKLKTPISMDKPKGGGMGISVVVKEPMAKKPLGTGASIIVKERRVLLNKDTYRKLFEKYYDKHGKWISGMKVPPTESLRSLFPFQSSFLRWCLPRLHVWRALRVRLGLIAATHWQSCSSPCAFLLDGFFIAGARTFGPTQVLDVGMGPQRNPYDSYFWIDGHWIDAKLPGGRCRMTNGRRFDPGLKTLS